MLYRITLKKSPPSQNAGIKSKITKSVLLELPILINGLDSPVELLTESLGKELFNWDVELLREDHRETRINVILNEALAYVN